MWEDGPSSRVTRVSPDVRVPRTVTGPCMDVGVMGVSQDWSQVSGTDRGTSTEMTGVGERVPVDERHRNFRSIHRLFGGDDYGTRQDLSCRSSTTLLCSTPPPRRGVLDGFRLSTRPVVGTD